MEYWTSGAPYHLLKTFTRRQLKEDDDNDKRNGSTTAKREGRLPDARRKKDT